MIRRLTPLMFLILTACSLEEETHCPTVAEVMDAVKDVESFKTTEGLSLQQAVDRVNNCQQLLSWNPKWTNDKVCRTKVFNALFKGEGEAPANPPAFDLKLVKKQISYLSDFVNFLFPAPGDALYNYEGLGGTGAVSVVTSKEHQNVVLYLHGGGYVLSLPETRGMYMQFGGHLSKAADAKVWLLDMPTAPEVKFKQIQDSAYNAYMALLEQGVKPENIFIMGDSAGGGLVVSLLFRLRDEDKPMPAGAVAISPWFDLAMKGDYSNTANDPSMDYSMFKPITDAVLQGDNPEDPMISPLYGDLHDIGPLLLIAGESEGLIDDTRRFIKKAESQDVELEIEIGEKAFHGYPIVDISEASVEAMHRIEDFTIEHAPALQE